MSEYLRGWRRAVAEALVTIAAQVRPKRDDTDLAFIVACVETVRAGVEGPRRI